MSLSCGHQPSPHSEYTTGTAYTNDGREICWSCADKQQKQELKTADRFVAYLTPATKGRFSATGYVLTTWSGGVLACIEYLSKGRHNIGSTLYRFRAVDVHGQRWYGTSPGPGMYARMRKAKNQ